VAVIGLGEAPFLVRVVVGRADEGLYFRATQQAVEIVIVAQEVLGEGAAFLLLAVFGGDGLQLFDEGVAQGVTGDVTGAIVDHRQPGLERRVQCPRANGSWGVWGGGVKTDFQQDALFHSRQCLRDRRVD